MSKGRKAAPKAKNDVPMSDEFDALLARMQTPASRAGMRSAFRASPKQLGKAAAVAARKHA
ncbi:MAG: hypothetical protein ACRD96_24240 [Bryobacteraceae bacterium]